MSARHYPSWMWSEACTLLAKAEQRQQRFMDLLSTPEGTPVWEPPADVLVCDRDIDIVLALPGARVDDVVIRIIGASLQIEARVPPPALSPRSRVLRLEIPYGLMRRRIALPTGHYRLTEKRFSNGCLYLHLQEVST